MYRRWQEGTGAVRWESGPALVVTRYQDVKAVMAGEHPVGNNAYRFGRQAERTLQALPTNLHDDFFEVLDFESRFISRQDGDQHRRLRRIASRAFTARRIAALRSGVERHVDELLAEFGAAGRLDFKRQVADRLPVRVIADLMGVPASDRDMVWEWSQAIADFFSVDAHTLTRARDALASFRLYVAEMVTALRRGRSGPELAAILLDRQADEAMTEDEVVAMYLLLLFGGTETTTNLLGNGFLALQRHRDQWDALVVDPALVPRAVEELLRYDSPHQYLPRYAIDGFEIAGERVAPGDTVIIVQAAANRDPAVFDHPDTLDIRRANARDHLSFAFGPHFCLGGALARLEGAVVFERLVTRHPNLRLLPGDMCYAGSAMLRAIQSLPVDPDSLVT